MRRPAAGEPSTAVSRRRLLRAGVLCGLGELAAPMLNLGRFRWLAGQSDSGAQVEVSARAADVVLGSTVIDMLGLLTLDWARLAHWQADPAAFAESDYRQLERSGIRVLHPAVETDARDAHAGALRWTARWNHLLSESACYLARVASLADLAAVRRQGKIGVVIGFQDSDHFRAEADVEIFHGLGQRVSQLTYNERNRLGSGCYERRDRGLTRFGAGVVAAMNRIGMAVDVSHCGERTSLDAIELSSRPVLITHANCKALVPWQPRCKSDAVIRAAARQGGVMGITMVRAFVGAGAPTLDDLLDHFDHAARVAGVEHVGLGSDVDVTAVEPGTGRVRPFVAIRGLEPAARVFQLADGLLRRGWSERDVELVLGGNFQRALAAIWGTASSSPAGSAAPPRRDPFCPAARPSPPPLESS